MTDSTPRRYYFEEYALTYTQKGWALLHKDEGLVGTDQFPGPVQVRSTREGRNLLGYVQEVMSQGLGETV